MTQVPIERLKELAGKIIAEHQADILTEPLAVGAIKAELRFAARSDMIAALRELISLRERSEWRDISTAPKDGTPIWVYSPARGQVVAWWSQVDGGGHPENGPPVYWWVASHVEFIDGPYDAPTHWRTLPDDPA